MSRPGGDTPTSQHTIVNRPVRRAHMRAPWRAHRRASADSATRGTSPAKVRPPIRRHGWRAAAHQPKAKHLIHSTHPLGPHVTGNSKTCIGLIHTSAAVGPGPPSSCPSSPYTAPGHDCAVITRPLVPQWAHIRRPPVGELSHLMKEAIGRNRD